ncbi:MAG: hypothetical protein OHK0039_15980 [Bacteroidia bacterium]
MSYTRARFRLGLLAQFVLAGGCVVAMVGLWPTAADAQTDIPAGIVLGLFVLGYMLAALPFDWLGGYYLPQRHGRSGETAARWWLAWIRGAGLQAAYFWLAGYALLLATDWLGLPGAIGCVFVQMLLLTGFQLYVARGVAHLPMDDTADRGRFVFYLDSPDRSFTGGIYGIPGIESIVLPTYWRTRFPERVQEVFLARRHGAINAGSHGRGVLLAILWNTLLFALAAWLVPGGPATVAGLLCTSLLFSLLSLLGSVGLLPWLSRRAVFEIDRWVFYKGLDADALRASFEATHRLQEDLGDGGVPVPLALLSFPTLEMRRSQLASQRDLKGAWQVGRHARYTSWAGLNLLARTPAYLLGRPSLWVFLPGD